MSTSAERDALELEQRFRALGYDVTATVTVANLAVTVHLDAVTAAAALDALEVAAILAQRFPDARALVRAGDLLADRLELEQYAPLREPGHP